MNLNQCCGNVGPPFTMMPQHYNNVSLTYHVGFADAIGSVKWKMNRRT